MTRAMTSSRLALRAATTRRANIKSRGGEGPPRLGKISESSVSNLQADLAGSRHSAGAQGSELQERGRATITGRGCVIRSVGEIEDLAEDFHARHHHR